MERPKPGNPSSSSATADCKEGSSDLDGELTDPDLKVILLGDSAVGKSKLVERFLMDEYNPRQLSTYALTLFRKEMTLDDTNRRVVVGSLVAEQ